MFSKIKIPTLFGLALLILGLGIGVFLTTQKQFVSLKSQASISLEPQEVTVTNITDTSVSISWRTETATTGFVQAGTSSLSLNSTFVDDRDSGAPRNHQLHFVTLTNLTPHTLYNYKITSGTEIYPPNKTYTFQTAEVGTNSSYQPIIGSVLNNASGAIEEAIVFLDIPGAQKLATVTKVAGNFVLPLASLKTANLDKAFIFPQSGIIANLHFLSNEGKSQASLKLPLKDNVLLPITIGKDVDLTPIESSPAALLSPFDLNKDGVINSLDMSFLINNYGKKNFDPTADLNHDGVVNQKDVQILNKYIPNTSPK